MWLSEDSEGLSLYPTIVIAPPPPPPASTGPLSYPLVQPTDLIFKYQGNFTVPSGTGATGFSYGGTGMAVNPSPNNNGGVLWLSGAYVGSGGSLQAQRSLGSVNLPTLAQISAGGASAAMLTPPVQMPNDINAKNSVLISGATYSNGSLFITKYDYYPPSNGPTAVISKLSPDLTSVGVACPMNGDVTLANGKIPINRYFGGQMTPIPSIWQGLLGGDTLITHGIGQGVVSVQSCRGAGLSVVNIGDVSTSGTLVNAKCLAGWYSNGSYVRGWNNGTMSSLPNVMASVSGGVLNIQSLLCNGIDINVNSLVMAAPFQTLGQYAISSSINVNLDKTGTYKLATLTVITGEAEGVTVSGALSGTLKNLPIPRTVLLTDGTNTWVDSQGDGNLYLGSYTATGTQPGWKTGGTVNGSINYLTGSFSISGGLASATVTGQYTYYSTSVPADAPLQPMFVSNSVPSICPHIGVSLSYGGDDFYTTYEKGIGAAIFIPGSRTVIVSAFHAKGPEGGFQPELSYHPCPQCCDQGGSGTSDPPVLRLFFYDLKALIDAKANTGSVSSVLPYAILDGMPNSPSIWTSTCQFSSESTCAGWMCQDTLNNLVYAAGPNFGKANNQIIHCWQIVWTPYPVGVQSIPDNITVKYSTTFEQSPANISLSSIKTQPHFPRTAAYAISGSGSSFNQSYPPTPYSSQVVPIGSNGFFTTGTYAGLGNPVPWMGRYDVIVIGANGEQWFSGSGGSDRGLLVDAIRQVTNVAGYNPADVFQYTVMEEFITQAAGFAETFFEAVTAQKWGLWSAANETGSNVPNGFTAAGFTAYETNWAVNTSTDQSYSTHRTTATYNGKPEDMMQYAAAYNIETFIDRHSSLSTVADGTLPASSYTDSRFYPNLASGTNKDSNKAPNLSGLFLDNCFVYPRYTGFYDLTNSYSSVWNSAIDPSMARGIEHFFARYQAIMANSYPSRQYISFGNIGSLSYVYRTGGGVTPSWTNISTQLANTLQGGAMEGQFGSGSADASSGFALTIAAYQHVMDLCLAPKLVVVFVVPSSATDWQGMRYGLGGALMDDGYCFITGPNASYRIDDCPWLDEYGGNPGTNVAKGWLGLRVGPRPSGPAISGAWVAEFDNGVAIVNPANAAGSVTVMLAQLNSYLGKSPTYQYHFIQGSQNPSLNSGALFSSVTLAKGDAVLLKKG